MKHPSCSVCEGEEHHWLPDCEDDEPFLKCKHCPETREMDIDDDDLDDENWSDIDEPTPDIWMF